MAIVYVNDKVVDIGDKKLNLVQAAEMCGELIPHYCYHPALSVVASCRMCLVEVGEKKPDGSIVMQPKVLPGCQTPAKDGTVVKTLTDKSRAAQSQTLEALLLNHPLDCPVCDKAGECKLQDYSYKFGNAESRMVDDKNTPPNKPNIGKNISLFTDRCIMCSRCVRFTREVAGTAELHVVNRGTHAEIDVFPGAPLDNKLASNVVDLCPVGALASNDFLYKHRVWNLKTVDSVCPGCSTGCSIHLDTNKNVIYRLRPRENPDAQGYFMCDDGRVGYHYANSSERISKHQLKNNSGWVDAEWKEIVSSIQNELKSVAASNPSSAWFMISPFLTVEEAYLLADYAKSVSNNVKLVLGPVPSFGIEDNYPKKRDGSPGGNVKFTIRPEKCPNRIGVEEVIKHFEGTFQTLSEAFSQGKPEFLFLAGSYPSPDWVTDELQKHISKVRYVVLQDLFPGNIGQVVSALIPSATFAEKEGVFVNHSGLAQLIHRGCVPLRQVRTEGQVYCDLAGRKGLVQASAIRVEVAKKISYFKKLEEEVGQNGTKLV